MLKQWIKQVVPGHYRPLVLKLLKLANTVRDLPAATRFHLRDRRKVVTANLVQRDHRVVFFSEKPSWREAKLAYGLKRSGWDVVQLHRQKPLFDYTGDFAELQQFSSPWHGVELAHKLGARLFHVFAPSCDDSCVRLVKHKPGRVIADFYDNFYAYSDGIPELQRKFTRDIAQQEYCYKNADAICARDMQLQYHRKTRNIARGKPIILFPEYCWDNCPLPAGYRDGAPHLVQIGWMGFERRGEVDVGCFMVAKAFVDAGCHFHIYLHPSFPALGSVLFKKLFQDYLALQAATGRVHFHPTIPAEQLVQEISRYDFGFNMINGLTFNGIPWRSNNPARFPYCGSSRLFDYLDAGLSFFVDDELAFMRQTFGRYGVLLDGTAAVRECRIREVMSAKIDRLSALRARTSLSVGHNIGRLIRFYEKLL